VIAKRVAHVITGLNPGGAEMMLFKLLSAMDRVVFKPEVISLTGMGPLAERIQALDITVRALGMRRGVPNPLSLLRLAVWLRRSKPDVIQTWMYHADLIGGIAAKLVGGIPVIWGIRHSNLDPQGSKRKTIWTANACARLSNWLPTQIVCCSEASLPVHAALGYATRKMCVIPNGFDLDVFRPDPSARRSVRAELGIPEDTLLIGMFARFHAQKDHRNFVEAAALLHAHHPDIHFLLCGDGITWENRVLSGWIVTASIHEHCHLLGPREDIPRLAAALDIASSSSFGEGFPNVVGEAMSCGVPCVVTDVGDSDRIVGTTGRIVAAKDPEALAMAWKEMIDLGEEGRRGLGVAARKRVMDRYELSRIVEKYEALYTSLE
jgi:glycosyltransferase involved in cell wall biosynthesis